MPMGGKAGYHAIRFECRWGADDMKTIAIALVLVAAVPLATAARMPPPLPTPVEMIIYRAAPCLGGCPEYSFTVSSDGHGSYRGKQYVAVIGNRSFQVTPEQFAGFSERLELYRPALEQETLVAPPSPLCPDSVTDSPNVEITWMSDGHLTGHLVYYAGCVKPKVPPEMWQALRSAPDLLPLSGLIGPERH
jgi:hypothetical protein